MLGKWAILVGIDDYEENPLGTSKSDVEAIAETLLMPGYGFNIVPLPNSNASNKSIRKALRDLRPHKPDIVVFYFSGHGFASDLGIHLITQETEMEPEDGITVEDVVKLLDVNVGETASTIIILDACYSGLVTNKKFRTILHNQYLNHLWIIAASEHETLTSSISGHGKLTELLLEGLLGDAVDEYGIVSALTLSNYMKAKANSEPITQVSIVGIGDFQLGSRLSSTRADLTDRAISRQELEQEVAGYTRIIRRLLRTAQEDPNEWMESGYETASRGLSPIFRFFVRKKESPQLRNSRVFATFRHEITRAWGQMSAIVPGTKVGMGIVEEEIGRGGFGIVWKVRSENGRSYAYKVCHAHIIAEQRENLGRFRRGFDAMKKLNHPSIVRVYEFTDAPYGFYMDFVDGPNWKQYSPSENMSLHERIKQFIIVAQAIQAAHNEEEQVLHRDIKPENILILFDQEGNIERSVLTDFDLSWFSSATQVTSSAQPMMHTMLYASPEFAAHPYKGVAKKPTTDIFSFGQLIYYAITGTEPYLSQQNDALFERSLEQMGAVPVDLAHELRGLYIDCTQQVPSKRIQSMGEVLVRLQNCKLILESFGSSISLESFLKETVYNIVGFDGIDRLNIQSQSNKVQTSIESVTKNSSILITLAEYYEGGTEWFHAHFDCRLVQELKVEGTSNFNEAREYKLKQLRTGLVSGLSSQRLDLRPGNISPFQVHVNLYDIPKTARGLTETAALLDKSIRLLER